MTVPSTAITLKPPKNAPIVCKEALGERDSIEQFTHDHWPDSHSSLGN